MTFDLTDIIAAPASAPGPAARGIVRISGAGCDSAVRRLFRPDDEPTWNAVRRPTRFPGTIELPDPDFGRVVISAAAYRWPNNRSFTGQPLIELHLPGSPPLVEELLAELYRRGVRPARAGEFTLRAFLAGRIDLPQAEAVLGVIDAADGRELEVALQQLAGGLSERLTEVRADLLSLLADLEAGLDFVEEDIEFVSRTVVLARASQAEAVLRELLSQAAARWRGGGRPNVVLAGLPNAGKSTLFNALVGDQTAIVSPVAGTTRDWIAAEATLDGLTVDLIDTAGWETPADELGAAMQRLRAERIERADRIIWCTAVDADARTLAVEEELLATLSAQRPRLLRVVTKADLPTSILAVLAELPRVGAVTGEGLEALGARLAESISVEQSGDRQMLGSTAARSRESLAAAAEALSRVREAAAAGFGDEVLSAELRAALDGLAAILGEVYTDDVLDLIFSRFCIGK